MIYRIERGIRINNSKSGLNTKWVKDQDYHVEADYTFRKVCQGRPLSNSPRLPLLIKERGVTLMDYQVAENLNTIFFIISEFAYELIKDFSFPNYNRFELSVKDNKIDKKYFCLHFPENQANNFLNWEASNFIIRKGRKEIIEDGLKLNDFEHYAEMSKKIAQDTRGERYLEIDNYELDKNVFKESLFIYSSLPAPGYYCSTKFLELVINAGLTGFAVKNLQNVESDTNKIKIKAWHFNNKLNDRL